MKSSDTDIYLKRSCIFLAWTVIVFSGKSFMLDDTTLILIKNTGIFFAALGFLFLLIEKKIKNPFISVISDLCIGTGVSLAETNAFLIGGMIVFIMLTIKKLRMINGA